MIQPTSSIGGGDGTTNTYDYYKGNQLSRSQENSKTWTQQWDAENRLIQVFRNNGADSSSVSFKYDPFSRRIEKQVFNTINGDTITKTVNYVYDAEDIVLQIEEVTHDSTTTTTETRFIHGPGIDEPLAFVRDGQSYFYHADGLGSIVAITNGVQAVAQKYSYESFGLPTPQTTLQQPYLFTGREWDTEIGLYFYRARYYDPMEGRFISEDPTGLLGGINQYAYVGSNAVNLVDPWGLFRSSPEAALTNAIIQGNIAEAQTIAAATGIVLTSTMIQAMESGNKSDVEKLIEDIIKKRNEEIANSKETILVEPGGGNGSCGGDDNNGNFNFGKCLKNCKKKFPFDTISRYGCYATCGVVAAGTNLGL